MRSEAIVEVVREEPLIPPVKEVIIRLSREQARHLLQMSVMCRATDAMRDLGIEKALKEVLS